MDAYLQLLPIPPFLQSWTLKSTLSPGSLFLIWWTSALIIDYMIVFMLFFMFLHESQLHADGVQWRTTNEAEFYYTWSSVEPSRSNEMIDLFASDIFGAFTYIEIIDVSTFWLIFPLIFYIKWFWNFSFVPDTISALVVLRELTSLEVINDNQDQGSQCQGSLFFVVKGETSLEKTPIFSWFHKKNRPLL